MEIKKRIKSIVSSCIEFTAIIFVLAVAALILFIDYYLIIILISLVLAGSLSIYIALNFSKFSIKIDDGIMVVQSGVMFRNKNIIKLASHSSSIMIKTPISRLFSQASVILFFQSGVFIIYSIAESDAERITSFAKGEVNADKTSLFDHLL